uniref:Uncharacterized protein n=1 Tax=Candidatus Kentrum sp. SD TaxID=2126332 RepID=A0A450Z7S2_9GAMM|nr:MAG: hypothetical protein BECKSD772F_GA0070984_12303 [Candidatus Kentron sp. SD]VFK49728.1 MAG: hypothetical protein BECKSD772E_GA0070983_12244 [Candidatus Kentron sp. SD]VFK81041.1 MAG: hypothetical protein BECKSD772D_GA0070982_12055 [Candidatus Kentron sp. SD]
MAIYAVIISENVTSARERIKRKYNKSDYHETPHGYFFIHDNGLTEEVAEKVGFFTDDEENQAGRSYIQV